MKTTTAAILAAFVLSACGGGGSAPTPTPPPVVVVPPVVTIPAPVFLNMATLTGANLNIGGSANSYLINVTMGGNVTLSGDINNIQVPDNAVLGVVQVSGNTNTVLIGKNVTSTSFTVTGKANTFWVPEGVALKISNTMDVSNSIKYYTPK